MFGRFYIVNAHDYSLAWTGAQWSRSLGGAPSSGIQICNFEQRPEAEQYAIGAGMVIER